MTPHETPALNPDEALRQLAQALGIGTEYWDWQGQHQQVSLSTIRAVVGAMGYPTGSSAEIFAAAQFINDRPWQRVVPPIVVVTAGETRWIPVHLPHGTPVSADIELEDGSRRALVQQDHWVEPRVLAGALVGEATFAIPVDLPLGWHRIAVTTVEGLSSCPLVVSPAALAVPPALTEHRHWGLMAQLYAARSRKSWGTGDLVDLADLAIWAAADHGADFILVNPLHAAETLPPVEPSPYLPTTRLF
ncbi:MAG: 4-alpha-glucanotransferase, partial [Angustibacter sp.]